MSTFVLRARVALLATIGLGVLIMPMIERVEATTSTTSRVADKQRKRPPRAV